MIPVQQDPAAGHCLGACIASLFEIPVDEAPNARDFWEGEHTPEKIDAGWELFQDWLRPRGYELNCQWREDWIGPLPKGYWIATMPSPRLARETHAVIFKGHKFVWDPFPKATQTWRLKQVRAIITLIVMDPASNPC